MNNLTEKTADNEAVIEYGARWKTGASSPEMERVIRKNCAMSLWEAEFIPNVGNVVHDSTFDKIDLFSPQLVTDARGNVFSRFARFYVSEQTEGEYEYIWVCKTPANSTYRLPRAFYHHGKPYWNYVDIGVYEGSIECVDGVSLLTSKSERVPTVHISRADAFNAAKANVQKCGDGAEREFYCITTLSEITEILQPLSFIMLGTKCAHSVYKGVTKIKTVQYKPAMSVKETNTVLFSYDKYKQSKLAKQFSVDCCVWYETVVNDMDELSKSSWRRVIASGNVEVDGTAYYAITLDGPPFKVNKSSSRLWRGINITGHTDSIAATHGTYGNDGTYSFKILGIENVYGNLWKHVLDCTPCDRIPYICTDITAWEETKTPESSAAFEPCGYTLCETGIVKEIRRDDAHPDVKLPVESVKDNENVYYCDKIWTCAFASTAFFGGNYDDWTIYDKDVPSGLSCWSFFHAIGTRFINIGARLSRRSL